jgi:DNA-binding response OmpR family regulator
MILPKHIVIVEDEAITQRYLKDILAQYDVDISGCFDNAVDVERGLKEIECDMLLMDININGPTDGIQLARTILRKYDFPIIFITAHNDDNTFEEVLELAPYGFIGKPFSSKDVVFTIQLAYQRYLDHSRNEAVETQKQSSEYLTIDENYAYSTVLSILYRDEEPVKLNKKQTQLMDILVQNANNTVGYDMLTSAIWKTDIVADSALRTLIYSIRKLLPDLPIVSYSKMGYSLETSIED